MERENNNEEMRIRKVPLESFLDILADLYDKGVNYIDIVGMNNDKQDGIMISFSKEYMDEEFQDNFDNIPTTRVTKTDTEINIDLSDDDLNQLL
jgi:hypothetical protein